jgi:hypothetical protein
MSFCGLRKPPKNLRTLPLRPREAVQSVLAADPGSLVDVRESHDFDHDHEDRELQHLLRKRGNANFEWARDDQLSIILESVSEARTRTPNWDTEEIWAGPDKGKAPLGPHFRFKRTRFFNDDDIPEDYRAEMSSKSIPTTPKPIQSPPRDVSSAVVALE